ncbi:MAG: membrane protease subunit, stomatin/prohibitin [Desulfobacteraceae bacterium IS3]|jgi:hypothetical protein|nr:MAG: membrane protease subunit, stomatin/prohibitin [Desulfobacteraceae bacterium IS3]HAO21024.1 membrane protease subunit, stomatin/prohibitin [Desulfobacteraceae bacterium]
MFGIRFIKVQPTTYLLQYKAGKIVREGAGLSFFYYAPTTSIAAVPIGSQDIPFIFKEMSSDFQEIAIQGQVTYRIINPKQIAQLLNFSLDSTGKAYNSDDPEKLPQRVINLIRVMIRKQLQNLSLRKALASSDFLTDTVIGSISEAKEISSVGVEVMGFSILSITPNPDTARALEAETREQLLKEADEAIYARRNSAVEQERAIKENELKTEIAIQEKQHEMRQADLTFNISFEENKKQLVELSVENARQEAESKAYSVSAMMKALSGTDPKTLQALASLGMKPEQLIALAFQELAGRAGRIGQLNVSPDLLRELMASSEAR